MGSVAPPSKPGNNNEKLSPFNPEPVEDMSNDFFKQKEGWWKDPFAMFEDDESMIDKNRDISADSSCQQSLQQLKLGSIIEPEGRTRENSPFLHAQPVIQYPTEQVTPAHILPTQDGQTPPDVAQGSRETPFGSRDSAVDSSSSSIPTDHETRPTNHDSINPFLNQAISAPVEPSLLHLDDHTKESKVVGIIWKAVPFVQVLLSFAFVKVAQPLMERLGNRHKYQEFTNHQADDRYASFSESVNDRSYLSYRHHETMTRGGGSPNSNWFRRTFGEPKTSLEVLPPARELVDQVEYLQRELSMVKSEKDAMEKEYEKASWQLQEIQNELANLQSTTNYLKAQIRDNQEVMDRAIRAERRKARDELTKMKEAMLQVLQRERQELRSKMMKRAAEVQAILKEREAADSHNTKL